MSLRAMIWSFDQHDTTPTQRLLLLALADHANADNETWPSVETLSEKTGFGKSTIYRERSALCDSGKMTRVARDRYRMHVVGVPSVGQDFPERESDSQSENGTTYRNPKEPQGTAPADAGERASDREQLLYNEYNHIVKELSRDEQPPLITPSIRRVAAKALAEFDLPDLVRALHGFVSWRTKKAGDKRFSSVFASHPGGRPLHDHIAFWIENADASPLLGLPSGERVKVQRAVSDVQRAFGSNDPDSLETGAKALEFLEEHGITPTPREPDGYPTFPSLVSK